MAREECKVLNCSAQKGTANPPNSNSNAAAHIFAISGLTYCGLWHAEDGKGMRTHAISSLVGGAAVMELQCSTILCTVVSNKQATTEQQEARSWKKWNTKLYEQEAMKARN